MEASDSGAPADFEIFERLPAPNYVERVRQHVAATGMPETFPGLHRGPICKDEPFYIVGPVSVPRNKRADEKMAPCPRCRCNDKFYDGQLVWFWRLKAAAVVGHCCAASELTNEATIEFRQRQARDRAENYLLTFLPDVPRHVGRARALERPIGECQRFHGRFRKDGGAFQRALRQATRGGGQLTVTERYAPVDADGPAGMRTSGSNTDTRDAQFGYLVGHAAIAAKCTLAADLAECAATFEGLVGRNTDDDALEFVLGLNDDEKAAASADLVKAIKGLSAIEEALVSFREFLTDANLARISAWGSHLENPTPMQVGTMPYRRGGSRLFGVRGLNVKPCSIVIDEALWADLRLA